MNSILVSEIDSLGHYVPSNRIDNDQLENHFHLTPGWIQQRTGIMSRRWAADGELLIDFAEKAGLSTLKNSSMTQKEIGLLILATSTPDHLLPPTAPLLAHRLGLSHVCAYDLSGACAGFLNALVMADSFVRTHKKAAIIITANILSRRINMSEYTSAILFGDAAAAIILKPGIDSTKGILGMHFLSDGNLYDLISISAGGSEKPFTPDLPLCDYKMKLHDGPAIFAHAIKMMTQCAAETLIDAHLSSSDINHFIPHQANTRLAEHTAKKLDISSDKIISIVNEFGNTSAAGIPLALSIMQETKPFLTGEKMLLTTVGAGMTAGALIVGM